MDILQRLASDISGYGIHETGAKDEEYYNCSLQGDKITYLLGYALQVYGLDTSCDISINGLQKVIAFIDGDFTQNERYYAFKALNREGEE